jgi:hypothetical protein
VIASKTMTLQLEAAFVACIKERRCANDVTECMNLQMSPNLVRD